MDTVRYGICGGIFLLLLLCMFPIYPMYYKKSQCGWVLLERKLELSSLRYRYVHSYRGPPVLAYRYASMEPQSAAAGESRIRSSRRRRAHHSQLDSQLAVAMLSIVGNIPLHLLLPRSRSNINQKDHVRTLTLPEAGLAVAASR